VEGKAKTAPNIAIDSLQADMVRWAAFLCAGLARRLLRIGVFANLCAHLEKNSKKRLNEIIHDDNCAVKIIQNGKG
jgi:hypothetical protein